MGRTNFLSPGGFNGPVSGGYCVFSFGPITISASTTTGLAFMGFKAPFAMRIAAISWNALSGAATASMILYQNTTMVVAAATTIMATQSLATLSGGIEGTGFTSTAARDVAKGQFVFVDPLIGTTAFTNFTVQIVAYVQAHPVAAGDSAD